MALARVWRRLRDVGIDDGTPASLGKHIRATNAAGGIGALLIGGWGLVALLQGHVGVGAENLAAAAVYAGVLALNRARRPLAAAVVFNVALFGQLCWALWADQLPGAVQLLPSVVIRRVNTLAAMVSMIGLTALFVCAVDAAEDSLIAAEARVDELLLNVLPRTVVARLKADPRATIADGHPDVTVLFADIVGFTPLASP